MKTRHKRVLLFTGIGVVLSCALIVGLLILLAPRIGRRGYQSGDSPEAVAHNYLMALVRQDYGRAYGYLSSTLLQYPDALDIFIRDLERHDLLPLYELDPCVYVEGVEVNADQAEVELRVQYNDPCLRGMEVQNLSFNRVQMRLEQVEGGWRIVDSDGSFFYRCWAHSSECE